MAVEWSITVSGLHIEEPQDQSSGVPFIVTVTNTGDETATDVGFYINRADLTANTYPPSSNGIAVDWYDILVWGEDANPAVGLFLQQAASTPVRFTTLVGASANTSVALTEGSGTLGNQLDPGESVELTIQVNPPTGTPTRRLYYTIEIKYA